MRRRVPGFRQDFGILDGDLVDEVIHGRAGEVLDHVLLVAMKELRSSHGVTSLIEADDVDDQSVSLPMPDGIPGVGGIGIFFVRASIEGHDAEIIAKFIQLGATVLGV